MSSVLHLGNVNFKSVDDSRGGEGSGVDNDESKNFIPSTPKPDPRHKYKTFCLKDHILLSKKRWGPSNITFLGFSAFLANWKPLGEKKPAY